jgi:pimeloyl-ACP methyl ester carboxylesterase
MAEPPAPDALTAPLLPFAGEAPPAPDWYRRALAATPETFRIPADGALIEGLAWGERGQPGLLLIHGAGGHAGWWRATAPYLAKHRRVAAFSLSGMGRSGWRDRYSLDRYADEALAVIEAAGLGETPVVVGHSFGGRVALRLAARDGGRLKAAVAVDTIIRAPGAPGMKGGLWPAKPTRVYPTLAEALARFRLAPLQPCENLFLVDAVARESLGPPPEGDSGGGEGWTWTFDPMLWAHLDDSRAAVDDLLAAGCPAGLVFGEKSQLMGPAQVAMVRGLAPGAPVCIVPEAEHHIMLDQPLALVAALDGMLAGWPQEERL